MNGWQRWLQAPKTHWLRKLLFQLHLWLGIGFGLYVLAISLSGSALLLKYRMYEWFEPKYLQQEPAADAVPLEGDALMTRMAEVYAGYELGFTIEASNRTDATYIVLGRDGEYFPHYFDQFSGLDIGPANPWPIKAMDWTADIHDDLLFNRTGRRINGVGGALFVVMSITGLIIWWQGRIRWYEGLVILPNSKRAFMWQLHSVVGFWSLLLMLAWGVSGFQLGFPEVVDRFVSWLDTNPADETRPLASTLRFFRTVHFARIGETELTRWAWIVVSFIPTLILVSGFILWWRRVARRWLKRTPAVA
jgi:uncharacterized iron-regulated membrane protein